MNYACEEEANNITMMLVHPRYAEGRNKFVNYVLFTEISGKREAVSSFPVITILSAISYGEKTNRCGWRKVWPVILAHRRLPFPDRVGVQRSAETFSFPVQSSGVFARIDTPSRWPDKAGGGNLKSGFHEHRPVCENHPRVSFRYLVLNYSPPNCRFASLGTKPISSSKGCEFIKIGKVNSRMKMNEEGGRNNVRLLVRYILKYILKVSDRWYKLSQINRSSSGGLNCLNYVGWFKYYDFY